MIDLVSAFDSLEYESKKPLKKYRKLLKKINSLTDYYRGMSTLELKEAALSWNDKFDIKNKKHIIEVYAIAREVCFRLLGKFQYDVQVLGALAALERKMIQMSTGSGKTITLILPAVAYGLTHKGCNVLTVNEYLSERDYKETSVVYDFFGLTSAYTNNDLPPVKQKEAFACDITYCTNATLGFAYLNSCLASGINADIKIIDRDLHAAIIDEVDEILMDDAINPLIIASQSNPDSIMFEVDLGGKKIKTQEIVDKLKTLRYMEFDEEDGKEPFMSDRTWNEIQELFDIDDSMFKNPEFLHVIHNSITAIFKHKLYEDYVVTKTPDPDSGSRIVLIDKATGRLSHGRTLNDNLHSFVEMKEGVFTGQATESSMQITYQVLFNLFENITGVTGTLGSSFKEFYDIYNASVVVIPDRTPNKLKEFTRLYMTKDHLYEALVKEINLYRAARFPVLVGAESDNIAKIISDILKKNDVVHQTLLSTDENEDYVVGSAGEINSVVVTTDIMGRGTDIKIKETDYERGLVVFQVGNRPNSRVERQFAGRAARQGEPGRYFRFLSLPDMSKIGFSQNDVSKCMRYYRDNQEHVDDYGGDLLLNGYAPYYDELVKIINDKLIGDESSYSTNRVQNFKSTSLVDLVQVSWVKKMDRFREVLKNSIVNNEVDEFFRFIVENSYEYKYGKYDDKELISYLREANLFDVQSYIYDYINNIIGKDLKNLRNFTEDSMKTVSYAGMAKLEVKSEEFMKRLIHEYLEKVQNKLELKLIKFIKLEEEDDE